MQVLCYISPFGMSSYIIEVLRNSIEFEDVTYRKEYSFLEF